MNLIERLLFGLLVGAVTYGAISLFHLKKRTKIIKPVPEESRLEILKKYSEYDICAESKKYPAAFVLNNKIPDILCMTVLFVCPEITAWWESLKEAKKSDQKRTAEDYR